MKCYHKSIQGLYLQRSPQTLAEAVDSEIVIMGGRLESLDVSDIVNDDERLKSQFTELVCLSSASLCFRCCAQSYRPHSTIVRLETG